MNSANLTGNKTTLPLQQLIDDILKISFSGPVHSKNSIVNNVQADLYVNANIGIVASVISGLLDAVISNATDGDIHISAKELFSNTIKVAVKDSNSYNTYAVAWSLQNMVPLAEKIGGRLNITNQKRKITTIEFSFPVREEEKDLSGDDD